MKKCNILFYLFISLSFAVNAQNENFQIKIIQDSTEYKADVNNNVSIKKKPFKIQIELKGIEGVYLFTSFKDSIYKIKNDKLIPGFKDIPSSTMAEESFNPNQELIISSDGWAYWFYKATDNWHRMDKEVVVTSNATIISKTVKQFYFPDTDDEVLLENNKKQLYLTFFSAIKNDNGELIKELQRYKVKINWL
jgi:hypothetical protein